jgi:LPS-assembly protein
MTGKAYVRAVATATPFIALISSVVCAQAPAPAESVRGISCWADTVPMRVDEELREDVIEMTTGDADIASNGNAIFKGPVTMRSRDISLTADSATYDSESATFTAQGGIEFQDGTNKLTGASASYDTRAEKFSFTEGEFEVPQIPARGAASKLEASSSGYLRLDNVLYTSCPAGNDDWILKARSIEIDNDKGVGTARGASLAFKGVPFIYVPYFTYPVSDERKSGLLFPKVGTSDRRGFELQTPFYWNIRPNMDATIIPRYMSRRGMQIGTEYRFLARNHQALLWGDYLADDKETKTDRWQYDVETESFLPKEWRATIRATGVSDDQYFEDMSSNRQLTSRTNLDRRVDIERYTRNWSMFFRVQDFQTIDPAILPEDEPYAQLPQFVADGAWRDGLLGLDYKLGTEATYFYRKESTQGARVHVQPEIALPLDYRGLYLTPEIAYDYTAYQLQDQPVDQPDNPSRGAPIASVDTGAVFDRLSGKNGQLLVTLEPRAQYTYIPFRDQSDIPVFDTVVPDFNLVQLFRKNRFIGYDRLGDTNQLSAGITSRVLDSGDGRELLAVTIGQTRYFDTGLVTLPDEAPNSIDASNYIAELDIRTWKNWNTGVELQWDSEQRKTDRSSLRLQYRPGEAKAINVAYRYVRDSVEQTDFSFAWPLGQKWSAIGRYNYSLRDDKALDRFAGLEYETCCWAISLLGQRSVVRSSGESDTSISFQFALKGLSNVGSGSATTLERDILGNWTH